MRFNVNSDSMTEEDGDHEDDVNFSTAINFAMSQMSMARQVKITPLLGNVDLSQKEWKLPESESDEEA